METRAEIEFTTERGQKLSALFKAYPTGVLVIGKEEFAKQGADLSCPVEPESLSDDSEEAPPMPSPKL